MAIKNISLPAGTPLMIGAPAHPMDRDTSTAIANLTASIDGIAEAHLPQLFAVGVMVRPAQVLVLVLRPSAKPDTIRAQLEQGLATILGRQAQLDIWLVLPDNPLLDDVRLAYCRVSPAKGAAGARCSKC